MLRSCFFFFFMFQSVAKPADWKYQSGVCSSWATVSCWLNIDLLVPLPGSITCTKPVDDCLKVGKKNIKHKKKTIICKSLSGTDLSFLFQEELKVWAQQIERGVCLIEGKKLPEDSEIKTGQVVKHKHNYLVNLDT